MNMHANYDYDVENKLNPSY